MRKFIIITMAIMPIFIFGQVTSKCNECKTAKLEITVISQVNDTNTLNEKVTDITFNSGGVSQDSIECGVYKLLKPKKGNVIAIDRYNEDGKMKRIVLTEKSINFTVDLTNTTFCNIFYVANVDGYTATQ
jgi:hypothetical protein